LKRDHVLAFGIELGLREKLAASTLDDVIKKIVPSSTSMLMIAEKERVLGEVRTIREIHYNCIMEMSGRLA
jgi:hypothetical protein